MLALRNLLLTMYLLFCNACNLQQLGGTTRTDTLLIGIECKKRVVKSTVKNLLLSTYTTVAMAKGLRASTKKANKTLLRQNVFGPIEAARKERLSAKLLELASKSSLAIPADVKMVDEVHEGERKRVHVFSLSTFYIYIFFWRNFSL